MNIQSATTLIDYLHDFSPFGHGVRALLVKDSVMRARSKAATISGAYEGSRVTLNHGLAAPRVADLLRAITVHIISPLDPIFILSGEPLDHDR
jgi:hypothetical protein